MRALSNVVLLIIQVIIASVVGSAESHAQTITGSSTIALRSGESAELGAVYLVSNCRSLLKGTPEAEVLDGPPGVSVAVRQEEVLPRRQKCANRVPGGMMVITAKDIEDPSYTPLTIRVTYQTRDGVRKFSHVYNLRLFP